jgi:hypothetical protein
MNLKEPRVSRLLGILIEKIDYKDQEKFLEDAEKAKSLRTFLKNYPSYQKV